MTGTLMQLLRTRSVSGHTELAASVVRGMLEDLGLTVVQGNKGTLLATLRGSEPEGVILCAHLDTLGAMVSAIEEDGTVRFRPVGSYTMASVEGEYCSVETYSGRLVTGTVMHEHASVHAHGREKASARRENDSMYLRLDERVSGREDVLELGVRVGNYVHLDPRPVRTESGYIKSRHLDDKVGVAIVLEVASRLRREEIVPLRTLHFLITGYEEVGHGGAGLLPLEATEMIAVDVGISGRKRETREERVTICAADSTGPFDYDLTRRLVTLAEMNGIPHVVDTYPFYGSDAAVALKSGLDVRHALVGPGVDSSHSVERTHEDGLAATADLLTAYVMG